MIGDSLRIKRIAIAYVYPAMPVLERKDSLAFYDRVTSNRVDFPEFTQKPFDLVMRNRAGTAATDPLSEVRVGQIGPNAYRLLYVEQGGTRVLKLVQESADIVYEAFQHVWRGRLGPQAMIEVSFNFSVAITDEGGALGFLRQEMDAVSQGTVDHLGRAFDGLGIRLLSNPLVQLGGGGLAPTNILANAGIELSIDSAPQDKQHLEMRITVKWPRAQVNTKGLPDEIRAVAGNRDILELNADERHPSECIAEVERYVTERILPFLRALRNE
jgi:hypothetical protein